MNNKKILSLLLAVGLLMSGCGKREETSKKSKKTKASEQVQTSDPEDTEDQDPSVPSASETRHFNIWDDETHIEYKREKGFYSGYCEEMIEEAKKRLPDEISKITVYKVNTRKISKYDSLTSVKDKYDLRVSSISCDLDSVKCYEACTMTVDSWSDKPTGIVLILGVNVRVVGTRTDTNEVIEETFISSFMVSRLGMTMTMDASEILDEGKLEFNYQYLDTCCGYFLYWISPSYLSERKLLDESILEYIGVCSVRHNVSAVHSSNEEKEYNEGFWGDFKGYNHPTSIGYDIDIYTDGHTGLEDPAKQQRETADPSMGDGDDEPWPDE